MSTGHMQHPALTDEQKAAVLDFLLEARSYQYAEEYVHPQPPEFGISWEWQATTPDRWGFLARLAHDAAKFFASQCEEAMAEGEPDLIAAEKAHLLSNFYIPASKDA